MRCELIVWSVCLTRPPPESGPAIFGFAEFLAALALLVLIFSTSDFLYRFRVSVAPLPLTKLTFGATLFIGVGTLVTDAWFSERWPALPWGISRSLIQAMFGFLFLVTTLTWIWFAFLRPPTFGAWNYKRYYNSLFKVIVRGSDTELPVVAAELARSAASIVRIAEARTEDERATPSCVDYAHDTLLMIANRKLCRHIVSASPGTAIAFMSEVRLSRKYHLPVGNFGRSITNESLLNPDSILYHEDEHAVDVVGRIQPFTSSLYSDFRLVEGNRDRVWGPLDLDFKLEWNLNSTQLEAYCRIVTMAFEDYIKSGLYHQHSYALYRAFGRIERAGRFLYKLNDAPLDQLDSDVVQRLDIAIKFAIDLVSFLDDQPGIRFGRLRRSIDRRRRFQDGIFDDITNLIFELIFAASTVRSGEIVWSIQHNSVWSHILTLSQGHKASALVRFKLTRLLFDEISRMENLPNYKGAKILGFCLNVLGLGEPRKTGFDSAFYPLHRAVRNWTRKNFMKLYESYPDIAEHCLIGGVTLDKQNERLVRTFARGLNREPSQVFLQLNPAPTAAGNDFQQKG